MFDAISLQSCLPEDISEHSGAPRQQSPLSESLRSPASSELSSSQEESEPTPLNEEVPCFSILSDSEYLHDPTNLIMFSGDFDTDNFASWYDVGPPVKPPAVSVQSLDSDDFDSTGSMSDSISPGTLGALYITRASSLFFIKNGRHENPWRELLEPLAWGTPALQNAMYAAAAFHNRLDDPSLGIVGLQYMQQALRDLSMESQIMPLESRLATILILAYFGWNCSVVTGVQHLQRVQTMIKDVLTQYKAEAAQGQLSDHEHQIWRFLCNTYVYIVVMSRLTDEIEADVDLIDDMIKAVNQPLPGELLQVDPLLGCGATLFSIFNRAVDLVQKLRKRRQTSLNMLSQAAALKQELEQWQPPSVAEFEHPKDLNCDPIHAIQTARAYRWAILLYLGQSFPELPSVPAEIISQKILLLLASIPATSGTMLVQCFPLLTAGCEAVNQDDRAWVLERWRLMSERFRLEKIETCRKVNCEVWRRRDLAPTSLDRGTHHPGLQLHIQFSDSIRADCAHLGVQADEGVAADSFGYTIGGRLHWSGVVSEQERQVFLG